MINTFNKATGFGGRGEEEEERGGSLNFIGKSGCRDGTRVQRVRHLGHQL